MKTTVRVLPAGRAHAKTRKHRSRPIPKWLKHSSELEAVARSRCLMLLSVLSGERPVTEAIAEAKISRGTYYQLETRALRAMLAVLNPLAVSAPNGAVELSAASARIAQLEAQVKRLEQDKRRAQRLWLLTRKWLRAPVTSGHRGRWPRTRPARAMSPVVSLPPSTPRTPSSDAPSSRPPGVRSP